MKCVCINDVVMERSGIVEFAKGRIYVGVPDNYGCFINNSGEPHYIDGPSVSYANFFNAHFIELVEEKNTSTNGDYIKCSDEVLKVINYSRDSVHGRKIIDIIKRHFELELAS